MLNAQIHPLVQYFLSLVGRSHGSCLLTAGARQGNVRICQRYCRLHPTVNATRLSEILNARSPFFPWAGERRVGRGTAGLIDRRRRAGADLFMVSNDQGQRQMVILETNSCPSGLKSMPYPLDEDESAGSGWPHTSCLLQGLSRAQATTRSSFTHSSRS